MTTTPSHWLITADAARYVQCERHLLYRAIKDGDLRAERVRPGGWRFRYAWLDAWLMRGLVYPASRQKSSSR